MPWLSRQCSQWVHLPSQGKPRSTILIAIEINSWICARHIVLSGTVYVGNANTVIPGEALPFGCLNTGPVTNPNPATVNVPLLPPSTATTAVTVTCGYANDNGEAPNIRDNHNVWNNANTDGNFGVSSPILLWDLSPNGSLLGELHVPSDQIVTSFSSKSELALNRSVDGRSLTFMGYRGGPGCPTLTLDPATNILAQGTNVGPWSPTAPNLLDVSASSTPGLCDPTNPAVSSYVGATSPTAYYRSVAEVDPWGNISYTDGDAYSGDNSRAAVKAGNDLYYSVGNDNNGGSSKKQMPRRNLASISRTRRAPNCSFRRRAAGAAEQQYDFLFRVLRETSRVRTRISAA